MFLGGHIRHLHCRCGVTSSIDVWVSIFGRARTLGIGAGVEGGLVQEDHGLDIHSDVMVENIVLHK